MDTKKIVLGVLIIIAILIVVGILFYIRQRHTWQRYALKTLADPKFLSTYPLIKLADHNRLVTNIKLDDGTSIKTPAKVAEVAWLPYLKQSFSQMLSQEQIDLKYPVADYNLGIKDVTDAQLLDAKSLTELVALVEPKVTKLAPMILLYPTAFQQFAAENKLLPATIQRIWQVVMSAVDYHETINMEQAMSIFAIIAAHLNIDVKPAELPLEKLPNWLSDYLNDHQKVRV